MRASLGRRSGLVVFFIRLMVILIYTIAIVHITRLHDGQYLKESQALAYLKLKPQIEDGSVADALYNERQNTSDWPFPGLNSSLINSGPDVKNDIDREKEGVTEEFIRLLITVAKNGQQSNEGTPGNAIRLLCWVLTDPAILDIAAHARDTWMQRCDVRLFMSSQENKHFPAIGLNVSEGRDHIAEKSKAAWTYIYENHRNDAEFFVKADPDSYIVVENLKKFLANCNPDEPAIYGHNLYFPAGVHYVAGEAVVLGRGALTRLVTKGMLLPDCYEPGTGEDLKTSRCLTKVGGYVVDTRDENGRETFLPPFSVEHIIKGILPDWYKERYRQPYGYCQSVDCLSDFPVAFHYIKVPEFYLMDYLLRNHRLPSSTAPNDHPQFRFNGTRYFIQS